MADQRRVVIEVVRECGCVQQGWVVFLTVLYFSRLGDLKLGQPDSEPDFPTASWFMMVRRLLGCFSCLLCPVTAAQQAQHAQQPAVHSRIHAQAQPPGLAVPVSPPQLPLRTTALSSTTRRLCLWGHLERDSGAVPQRPLSYPTTARHPKCKTYYCTDPLCLPSKQLPLPLHWNSSHPAVHADCCVLDAPTSVLSTGDDTNRCNTPVPHAYRCSRRGSASACSSLVSPSR